LISTLPIHPPLCDFTTLGLEISGRDGVLKILKGLMVVMKGV